MTRYNQSDMYALAYLVVAVISAVLTTRSWVGDRNDEGRRRLFILGWAVAIVYAAFALSLHPSLYAARTVYMAVGGLIPAVTMWTVEHLFRQEEPDDKLWLRPLLASSVVCVPAIMFAHVIMLRAGSHQQIPANVLYAHSCVFREYSKAAGKLGSDVHKSFHGQDLKREAWGLRHDWHAYENLGCEIPMNPGDVLFFREDVWHKTQDALLDRLALIVDIYRVPLRTTPVPTGSVDWSAVLRTSLKG